MERLLAFGHRHAAAVILVVLLAVASAMLALPRLDVDVSSDTLIVADSPGARVTERQSQAFGGDRTAAVVVEDPALFTTGKLATLAALEDALRALPCVERIDSLATIPDLSLTGGSLDLSPPLSRTPESEYQARKIRETATANPLFRGALVSADGNAVMLVLTLDGAFIENSGLEACHQLVEEVVDAHRGGVDSLYQLGGPAIQADMKRQLRADCFVILPLAGAVLLLLLSIFLRSFRLGLLPLVNAVLASLLTLSLMAWLGIPLTLLNYILPTLILVIGATEDIHLLHEYRHYLQSGLDPEAAWRATGRSIGLAITLTATTTMLGFGTPWLSDLPILQSFGQAAMLGMAIRFVLSTCLVPAWLRAFPERTARNQERELDAHPVASRIADGILRHVTAHSRIALALTFLVLAASLVFATKIRISNDLLGFLDDDSPAVANTRRAEALFAGLQTIRVSHHGEAGTFNQLDALRGLHDLTRRLAALEGVDHATSFASAIARMNGRLRDNATPEGALPESQSALDQLLLFIHPAQFESLVTPDFATAAIQIRTSLQDSTELNQLAEAIRTLAASHPVGMSDSLVGGRPLLVAGAVGSITSAQTLSLAGMAAILFLIVSAIFLSFRCGLLTLLANLFSTVLLFGIMGAGGVPLNIGTCMVAAITLGIVVDDTIHLIVRFNREIKSRKDEREGVRAGLASQIPPIAATSLALAGGFFALTLSSFQPVRDFGWLSATIILAAAAVDFLLTPTLFANTKIVTLWDVLGLDVRNTLLKRSPFFHGLSTWQARKLILATNLAEYQAREPVIRQGESGNTMYIVLSGNLDVVVERDDGSETVASIGPGEIIGEAAFVTGQQRTASIIPSSPAKLLALQYEDLENLRKFSPYLASHLLLNISRTLSERLANTLARD